MAATMWYPEYRDSAEKVQIVETMAARLKEAGALIVADYRGLREADHYEPLPDLSEYREPIILRARWEPAGEAAAPIPSERTLDAKQQG